MASLASLFVGKSTSAYMLPCLLFCAPAIHFWAPALSLPAAAHHRASQAHASILAIASTHADACLRANLHMSGAQLPTVYR